MFKTVLIANRGEIACRVIRTARRLGIRSLAVYSDADVRAMHVDMADEAYRVGPAPAADSYLNTDRLIEACRNSGADAVHPGYGFLSENPEFAEAVGAAGLTFIGPPVSAIRAMALKDAAKSLMQRSGVPIVPGYHGDNQDPAFLLKQAHKIGFPVLIKARAGGGGKGMRRVERPEDFAPALDGARREARAAFGDERCLIEKYVAKPRHIEVQVFGDAHGNVVHLFERDCSLQRRHQKVIEEAPAPGLDTHMRETIGEMAVRAAKAISYTGAGTVEFIADVSQGLKPDRIYFMEMNTRLQVEHPVTECITGQDLVEWQFRVAAGERLPLAQKDLTISGWALEARVYAEDPANNFLPATGRLHRLSMPVGTARIDSGVRQGDEVGPYYDPMLAKVIVNAPTRSAAIGKLIASLEACHIGGIISNIAFLVSLCKLPEFAEGDVDTGLIERNLERINRPINAPSELLAVATTCALALGCQPEDNDPWSTLSGWRHWTNPRSYVHLENSARTFDVSIVGRGAARYVLEYGNETLEFEVIENSIDRVRLSLPEKVVTATAMRHGRAMTIDLGGRRFEFKVLDGSAGDEETETAADEVIAPMPGFIKLVATQAGAKLTKGDPLVVLEAMKMEHTLRAPRDGVVAAVFASPGDHVQNGAVLLSLEAENA